MFTRLSGMQDILTPHPVPNLPAFTALTALSLLGRTCPKANSSAEDQARRAEFHAWIARICASLPPKLIDPLLFARFRAAGDFFSCYQ
jgi:hypothetical protein